MPTSISSCCWLKIVSCLNCRFFISSSRIWIFWLVSSFFIALKLFSSLYTKHFSNQRNLETKLLQKKSEDSTSLSPRGLRNDLLFCEEVDSLGAVLTFT